MIKIGEGKRSGIFEKVQTYGSGDVRKRPVAIVRVEGIALVSAPGAVGTNQLIERVPSLFVVVCGLGFGGRICHDLSPEEAV